MDTMRGSFGSLAESEGYDQADDDTARQAPPPAIGQDERRMQVRAYNHWASLLNDRNFPAIEDLEPENLPDFGPYSVLLDFSSGVENPGIAYLGAKLAEECDVGDGDLNTLADVPARSLLSRITDHYLQIIANQAPIGFEAEFVNQRAATIAYRGILLPYSSDDDTIDFIYGVINWKELADAQASDELLLEIDQALEPKPQRAPLQDAETPLTDWADGPGAVPANDTTDETQAPELPTLTADDADFSAIEADDLLPAPSFGLGGFNHDDASSEEEFEDESEYEESLGAADEADAESPYGSLLKTPIHLSQQSGKTPVELPEFVPDERDEVEPVTEIALPELDPSEMELGDWLAAAREMAAAANSSEDRTRNALYEAIGRAYDFSLAAAETPNEFEELLTDAGLTMQDRAPMTPVVKLVFGPDYDKTRLTEYAAALTHAHRLKLERGTLGEFLVESEGGLKGVVKAERRLRREEAGKTVEALDAPRHALAKKLRALPPQAFDAIAPEGSEFALVMIRRTDAGEVVVLGEVPDDVALVERAARRLIG
jgi:hypothetical protein